ncbi:MAG: hypothetical protein NUV51_09345 [Sulfuricaulis sp.]|nr:hypothetical protein [Sulfuricaulis sp.]
MSLLDVVRSAVKIADEVTKPLQATVTYERYTGSDGYGTPTYAAAVSLRAIVDYVSKQVRTQEGILTVSRATITLLDIAAVVAATGGAGIDNNDKFTLPDGDTGPLLDIRGFVDAGTTHPIATEIVIG